MHPCPQMVRTHAQLHPLRNTSMLTDGKNPRSSADKHTRSGLVEVERKFGSAFLVRKGVSPRRNAGRCPFGACSCGFEDIAKATFSFRSSKPCVFFCGLLSRDVQKPSKDLSAALAAYRRRCHDLGLGVGNIDSKSPRPNPKPPSLFEPASAAHRQGELWCRAMEAGLFRRHPRARSVAPPVRSGHFSWHPFF